MSWDWNRSGRIDTFYFEKINPTNLNDCLGELEGYITGGSLTFNYNSDTKVSGTLNIVNAPYDLSEKNFLIRIWLQSELDGETEEIELGTFYFTADLTYNNGKYDGSIKLKSTLCRYTEDTLTKNFPFKKGNKLGAYFKYAIKLFGKWGRIEGALANRKIKKTNIVKLGQSPMRVLQYIADKSDGEIMVDSHGVCVLRRHLDATEKEVSYLIAADEDSVITSTLGITSSFQEAPNRVMAYTEVNKKVYKGFAELAKSDGRSKDNMGRYITAVVKVSGAKKPYKKNLAKVAREKLIKENTVRTYYEFETFFQPIEIGEVVQLNYGNISVNGLVTDIDLTIGAGAKMKVKMSATKKK